MKPRILIVEDEAFSAAQIGQQLAVLYYNPVATTAYGEEAVSLAEKQPFDLALVDLRLAGEMDGITAALILRERFGLASILITAAPDQSQIERAIQLQPYGYLAKPFNTRVLYLAVEMALHRLRIEATLSQREDQMEAVLRTSMDSFWIARGDGQIVDVNDATCRMTGYRREELLQMTIADLEHGCTQQQIAEDIDLLRSKGSTQIERHIRCKDGQLRTVEMSITCSPSQHLYCFGRDITERKATE
jgi:PAS domain S-box-containing protein